MSDEFAHIPRDSEAIYRYDLSFFPRLTDEEEAILVERIRKDDMQARDPLLSSLLSSVERRAWREYRAYGWSNPRLEYLELVEVGNLSLVENFWESMAQSIAKPCAYLLGCAYTDMRFYRLSRSFLVKHPSGHRIFPLESLELFLAGADADIAEPEVGSVSSPENTALSEALRKAIGKLCQSQRETLVAHFGLEETPEYSLAEVAERAKKTEQAIRQQRDHALLRLRGYLQVKEIVVVQPYEQRAYEHQRLTPEQCQVFEEACATLRSQGKSITGIALARQARTSFALALAYCRSIGLTREATQQQIQEQQRQRVAEAIRLLQQEGKPVTTRAISASAHVGSQHAAAYLRQWRGEEAWKDIPPLQRIEAAIEQLQQAGRFVTQRTVATMAHVGDHRASQYLQQWRRDQQKSDT